MDYALDICNKLNLDPNIVLKKKIRGLSGVTIYSLVHALIHNSSIAEASKFLGYSDNPIKQAIRNILKPIFSNRKESFCDGGSPEWRNTLLYTIGYKHCPSCSDILSIDQYTNDSSSASGKTYRCRFCLLLKSKEEKQYIMQRTPAWSEIDLIAKFYKNCPKGYHVDHDLPLRGELVSGLHVLSNLRYLPALENISKGNKFNIS